MKGITKTREILESDISGRIYIITNTRIKKILKNGYNIIQVQYFLT